MTLDGALRNNAERQPDALAVVDGERRITWMELERAVDALASHLRARGVQGGAPVVAFSRRDWRLPVLLLASTRAGGAFLAVEPRADASWLGGWMQRAAVIAFPPDAVRARMPDDRRVIHTLDGLLEGPGPGPSSDASAVCYLHLGRGPAGGPTVARVTHAHVAANTQAVLRTFPFRDDERYLCLFSAAAHPHEIVARPLFSGATAVLLENLRPRAIFEAIVRHEVTWLFAPSTAVRLMCEQEGPAPAGLRYCEVGGPQPSTDLLRRAAARLRCPILPIWACTETTGVALWAPTWCESPLPQALGHPLPGYEFEVRGEAGERDCGELLVRGPAVVRTDGSCGMPGDEWVATGDLVRREAGALYFLGRRDERIDVAGVPLLPHDIERVIQGIDGIRDVVVVAGRDAAGAPLARAAMVTDGKRQRSDVLAHCRARLRAGSVPCIEFWDDLPRDSAGEIDRRAVAAHVGHGVALAINTMVIGDRKLEEAFALAAQVRADTEVPVILDLRSRRAARSDPSGTWAVAHANADFDLADPREVDRAIALSRAFEVPVGMASAYVGACEPADLGYGHEVIEQAYRLAEVAPGGRLVLRVLGGDLLARARGMRERWQEARRNLRNECVQTLHAWEAHTRRLAANSGRRVYLGLEVHHGQYLGDLADIHHCCRAFRDTGWDLVGFIEDPANRFIAGDGDLIGAMDFARMTRAWGGRVLAYHLKDVRHLSAWSQFHPQPMQRVGDRVFVWGTQKFEWAPLGTGEVDVRQAVMAARLLSEPAHPWCPISTECVAASTTASEAEAIVRAYVRLIEES